MDLDRPPVWTADDCRDCVTSLDAGVNYIGVRPTNHRSGLKVPAQPSCRPTLFIFQYPPLWRFFKNKFYLNSLHRIKAISGTLIIIVNSYNNLDLVAISLKLHSL